MNWQSILSEEGSASSSRLVMIVSVGIAAFLTLWAVVLVTHAYIVYGPNAVALVDVSWLVYGGAGSGASGVFAYGINKWSSKSSTKLELTAPLTPHELEDSGSAKTEDYDG
jgi:hypothetical protein